MNLLARLFKFLFRFPLIRKRYFGFYTKIFKPLSLFKGQTSICRYDIDLKIKVNLDDWIQQHIYFFGIWDEPGTEFLKNNLKKDDIFIDIGANIGSYSLIASNLVGENGKVYAFEPVAGVFDSLLFNIKLNHLNNIVVIKKAILDTTGTINLFISKAENLGMSGIFHHDNENGKIETVETISLDEYISDSGIERIDMIKIDIEGAELFALKGMKRTIDKFKPVILMEISEEILHKNQLKSSEIIDFMKENSYSQKRLTEKGIPVEISDDNSNSYTNNIFIPVKR